jgi:glutathione S-transferase
MAQPLIVYGTEGSPFVRKVLVVMAEKGLDWALHEVDVFAPPEDFLAISPAKRIPVLRVGDATLADSSAICGYLERRYPDPALYPAQPLDYGRALWFEEYADTLLAARIGFGLLRTLVTPVQKGTPPDLERAGKAFHEDLPPLFDYLEQSLVGRQHFVGAALSIADIAVAAQLAGLRVARVPLDGDRWPALAAFTERMLARPSFQVRMEAVAHMVPREAFIP